MEQIKPMTPIDRARTDVHLDVEAVHGRGVMTPRKRRMIDAYMTHGTYSEAARASGFSPTTVKNMIEKDPHVRKALGQLVDQAAMVTGITLERVLAEYARLAFSDVGEVMDLLRQSDDPDAAAATLADLPQDVTAAISEVQLTRTVKPGKDGQPEEVTGNLKLKFHDKKGALQDLARMLSLFNDKLTIEDNSSYGARLRRVVEKLEAENGA